MVVATDKLPVQIRTRKFIRNALLCRRQFVVDIIHPGRANVSKAELQEKIADVSLRILYTYIKIFIHMFIY